MSKARINWQVIIILCVLCLLIINTFISAKVVLKLKELQASYPKREQLPCGAVPTRFVIEEPECDDKLLRSMNVTNVRILPVTVEDDGKLRRYLKKAMPNKFFEEVRAIESTEGQEVKGEYCQ